MDITGVEVIRNPGVAIGVVAGEKVELTYGDTLRVNVSFDYRGLARTVTLYGAIGNWRRFPEYKPPGVWFPPGFDEILHGEVSIDLPESIEFSPCKANVDIPITSDISPQTDYDLYVKIKEYPGVGMPRVDNVIDIVGIPPTFELIQHTVSHFAYIYDGDAEVNIATFKIDPFTPSAWAAKKFADALESEARKKGARVLETKVYVDTTPLLWTDIRIEVTGTPLGEEVGTVAGRGIAVGIAPWLAIILVCLAIIAVIIVATLAFDHWMEKFKHKPISEEIKKVWSRETLISAINDFVVKLEETKPEFTPKPPEEIEAMSDDELRDYCDQLAEWIVPPVPDLLPLLVLGGLGVLGVGGVAVVYAMSKKPKE
ncbi:hypothetical protein ES708_14533 [subsurface metagenome]